jgi:hypothetical protein
MLMVNLVFKVSILHGTLPFVSKITSLHVVLPGRPAQKITESDAGTDGHAASVRGSMVTW